MRRVTAAASQNGSTNNRKGRRMAVAIFGFVLSGVGLWYVFSDIDLTKVVESASRIRFWPLLGSIALYWLGVVGFRSYLVRHLLASVGDVSPGKAYRYICIGFLANNLLPLRMGEVIRVGGISRSSGVKFVSVAGGLAVERLLDLIMSALIGLAAIQVAPLPENVRLGILSVGGVLLVAFLVLVFMARRGLTEIPLTDGRSLKLLVWNLVVRFSAGFGALGSTGGLLRAVLLSVALWLAIIGTMLLRLKSFDLPPSIPLVLVMLTGISLGVSLPSAPGYVGVYHALLARSLMLMGIDEEIAVGFAIYSHLVDIAMGTLLGLISMGLEGLGWDDLKGKGRLSTPKS